MTTPEAGEAVWYEDLDGFKKCQKHEAFITSIGPACPDCHEEAHEKAKLAGRMAERLRNLCVGLEMQNIEMFLEKDPAFCLDMGKAITASAKAKMSFFRNSAERMAEAIVAFMWRDGHCIYCGKGMHVEICEHESACPLYHVVADWDRVGKP